MATPASSRPCGLDFGTSNTALAWSDGTVAALQPHAAQPRLFRSVLFFPEDEREAFTGAAAIDRYLEDPAGRFIQSVKSFLHQASFRSTMVKGRVYTVEELVALLLKRVREAAGNPTRVVLGRPAVFSPEPEADALAEQRLRRAAGMAGFEEVVFLIEPIAAALAYEASLDHDELVLVADFGAGTTDFTLMRLGPSRRGGTDRKGDVVGSTGVRIGGDRFDGEVMRHRLLGHFGAGTTYSTGPFSQKRLPVPQHLMSKLLTWHDMSFIREKSTLELLDQMLATSENVAAVQALEDLVKENLGYRLFRVIEQAKVDLSARERTELVFEEARIRVREPLTRGDFEAASAELLTELGATTDRLLADCGVSRADVDAVFLTGGSSQIPAVRRLYAGRFGEGRVRSGEAFTSVAEGLGRAAPALLG
jgi:hypothetical chaperone protein